MKTGTAVRLIQPVIAGVVKERRINPATDELEVLVEWTENDQPTARWFDAAQLEEVTP
jgi:hypothetical protein